MPLAHQYSSEQLAEVFPRLSEFEFLDRGSFKSVYRVFDLDSGREAALKVFTMPDDSSLAEGELEQEVGRIKRELSLLAAMDTPHIVKLDRMSPTALEIDGKPCIAYTEEFLPGSDLRTVIRKSGQPSEGQIVSLLQSLILGIQALWTQKKTVHRDIKPANIFATGQEDRPFVLLDLGIAYNVLEPGLTLDPNNVPGTRLYLAPEMLDPNFRQSLSYRADLYAIGLTAYEYASGGIHPLAQRGDSPIQTITRILNQEPEKLETLRTDLSPNLCKLIDQLIRKKPALRPGNMNLILKQLSSIS